MNTFTITGMVRFNNFRQTQGRQAVSYLSVAAETPGHNAQFVDVVLFGKNAQTVRNVERGEVVKVVGYIAKTKRERNGQACYEMQLIADNVQIIDRRQFEEEFNGQF